MLLVIAAALVGGAVARRLGYPSILGELLAGIVLGPPLLGILSGNEALMVLGEFGVLLMMLYIGIHIDLHDLRRASWAGLLAAVGGFIVPAGLGFVVTLAFGGSVVAAVFVALAMGVTSLATKSRILVDLKILDTRIAHVLMVGALVSDLAALIIFAGVIGLAGDAGDSFAAGAEVIGELGLVGVKAALFVVAAYVVGTRLIPAGGRWLAKRANIDTTTMFVIVVFTGVAFAEAAELAGLHAILGAFLAGLFIGEDVLPRRTSRSVQTVLQATAIGLLAPIFFVTAGFEVTFDVFRTDLVLLTLVVVLATLGKVVGTALFYIPSGNGWREGVAVGVGMNGRGAVEIIVAEIALTRGLIDQEVFSILVFMAIATTASVPVLLTMAVRWLDARGELVRPTERRRIVIVGAGPVARALARAASPRPVTLVDTNPDLRDTAIGEGLDFVYGSALEDHVLANAHVAEAGYLIAMTPNSRVNVLAAQIAANNHAVPSVLVALGSHEADGLTELMQSADAARLFEQPVDLAGWDYAYTMGAAREVTIELDGPPFTIDAVETQSEEIGRDDRATALLPLLVIRGEQRIPFAVAGDLERGDRVFALARSGSGLVSSPDPDHVGAHPSDGSAS